MLAELRQALADTVQRGVPQAHVEAYPVDEYVDNPSGVHIAVEGDLDRYLTTWASNGITGRGVVRLVVVVTVPNLPPKAAHALLDSIVDPLSDRPTVLAAIMTDRTLGLPTTFAEVSAFPLSGDVGAPAKFIVGDGESNIIRWRVEVPVEITVTRR